MPHVDESTLHALLDGELAPQEAAEVRVHFATCASCAARLAEARQLLAETERLVSALELPGGTEQAGARGAAAGRPADPRPLAAAPSAVADAGLPPFQRMPPPPLDPVVLIPENPTIREVRRGRLRLMGWAAGFLVVVGAGFLGVANFQRAPRSEDGRLAISPDEFTTAPPRSEREGARPDTATLGLTDADVPAPASRPGTPAPAAGNAVAATEERKPAVQEPRAVQPAPQPPEPAARLDSPRAETPRAESPPQRGAASAPAPIAQERADSDQDAEPQLAKAADSAPRDRASGADGRAQPVTRTAAQATFELDRRRTRERAAEATAALDREMAQRRAAEQKAAEERERKLAAERAAAAAAPAARPAADDRTGLSSRIGLDEAARQLGGPLHAIDGLSRQTVGLVPGSSVQGADPDRPVVRAVYLDRVSGTMLFLDQQMARPGEGPATPQTGPGGRQTWVKDGVLLVLHGDLTADSLRSLARRVR